MAKIIPGEYDLVALLSKDQAALRLAHETPLTRGESVAMIQALAKKHKIENLKIHFRAKNGKATRWPGDHKRLISLPREGMAYGDRPYGRLRVGLILHEFAHHLAPFRAQHGPSFVEQLDLLICDWIPTYRMTNVVMASAWEELFNA